MLNLGFNLLNKDCNMGTINFSPLENLKMTENKEHTYTILLEICYELFFHCKTTFFSQIKYIKGYICHHGSVLKYDPDCKPKSVFVTSH